MIKDEQKKGEAERGGGLSRERLLFQPLDNSRILVSHRIITIRIKHNADYNVFVGFFLQTAKYTLIIIGSLLLVTEELLHALYDFGILGSHVVLFA